MTVCADKARLAEAVDRLAKLKCDRMKPIAISLGDPAGIGPEVVARALAERPNVDLLVFGDPGALARAASAVGVAAPPAERVRAVRSWPPVR